MRLSSKDTVSSVVVHADDSLPPIAKVPQERLLQQVNDDLFTPVGLLPPVVKWYSQSKRFWLFERPPRIVTLTYSHAMKKSIEGGAKITPLEYNIPLPWQAYLVEVDRRGHPHFIWVYALHGPIMSDDDIIGLLPLPNFYTTGRLCTPDEANHLSSEPMPIARALDEAYRLCWDSGSNADMTFALTQTRNFGQPYTLVNALYSSLGVRAMLARWATTEMSEVESWTFAPPHGIYDDIDPDLASGTINKVGSVIAAVANIEKVRTFTNPQASLISSLNSLVQAAAS